MPACVCLPVRSSACVCALVGCADLMTLDTMTPQERKRQGYIHELIQTEETYVEDLELVLEVQTNTRTCGHIQNELTFSSEFEPLVLF